MGTPRHEPLNALKLSFYFLVTGVCDVVHVGDVTAGVVCTSEGGDWGGGPGGGTGAGARRDHPCATPHSRPQGC